MEIKVKTTFNGREMRVPGDDKRALAETLERHLRAAAMDHVRARAGHVRCRVHGRTAMTGPATGPPAMKSMVLA